LVHARSEWDIRAEAQYDYFKFISKLRNVIEMENPDTYEDYKKVILLMAPEFKQILEHLDSSVRLEFCKIASASSEFPIDCNIIDESLPLPTSFPNSFSSNVINTNSTDPCFRKVPNNTLTLSEGNTSQMDCIHKRLNDTSNGDLQGIREADKGTSAERLKERLTIGCESVRLLSNETQMMLKLMNKSASTCFEKNSTIPRSIG